MIDRLDPLSLLVRIAGFLVAISVHEFSHAFAAWRLGDPTARQAGRLTLNPLRHLDPWGSILLLVAGFGWGKPVPVDPRNLRHGRLGMAVVSGAGPASNLITAFLTVVATLAYFHTREDLASNPTLFVFLRSLAELNVGLCIFNLIPLPPLDGFGVLIGILPLAIARLVAGIGRYGPGILLLLFFLPSVLHVDLLGAVLGPARAVVFAAILAAAQFVLSSLGVR